MGCLSSKLPDSNGREYAPQPACHPPTAKASLATDASASCRPRESTSKLIETNLLLTFPSNRDLFDPGSNFDPNCSAGHGASARKSVRQQPSGSLFSQSPLLATVATSSRQGLEDGASSLLPRGAGSCGGGGVVALEEHVEDEEDIQGFSTAGVLPYNNLNGTGPGPSQDPCCRSSAGASSGVDEHSSDASQTLLESVVPLLIHGSRETNHAACADANEPSRANPPAATTVGTAAHAATGPATHIINHKLNPSFMRGQMAGFASHGGPQTLEFEGVTATATAMTAASRRLTLIRGLTRDSFAMNNTTGGGICSGYMMRTVTAREELLHTDVNWPPFQMGNPLQVRIGELLGRGGCGSVYQGEWCGRPVAVKVVQQVVTPPPGPAATTAATGGPLVVENVDSSSAPAGAGRVTPDLGAAATAAATAPGDGRAAPHLQDAHASVKRLRHPNVLRTHAYAVLSLAPQLGGILPARYEHHVVLELCDGGSLRTWLDKRLLELEGAVREGPFAAAAGGEGGGGHYKKAAGLVATGDATVRQALERAQTHIARGTTVAASVQSGAAVAASSDIEMVAEGGCGGGGGDAGGAGAGAGLRGHLAQGADFARQAPLGRFHLPFQRLRDHYHEHDHPEQHHPERPPPLQPHPPAQPSAEAQSPPPPQQQQQQCGQLGSGPGEEAAAVVQPSDLAAAGVLADRLVAAVTAHGAGVAAAAGPTCSACDSGGGGAADAAVAAPPDDVDADRELARESLSCRVRGLTLAQSEQLQLLGMTLTEDDLESSGQKTASSNGESAGGGGGTEVGVGGVDRLAASEGDAWRVMGAAAGDNSRGTISAISDPSSRPSRRRGALVASGVVPAAAVAAERAPLGADCCSGDSLGPAGVSNGGGDGDREAVVDGSDAGGGRGGSGCGGADACLELAGGSLIPAAAATAGDAAASGGLEAVRGSPSPPSADLPAAMAEQALLAYANTSIGSYGGGGSTVVRPGSSLTVQQHFVILGDPDEESDNISGEYDTYPMYGKPSHGASNALSGDEGGGGGLLVTFGHGLRRPDGRLQQLEEDSAEGQQSRGYVTTSSVANTATAATTASVSLNTMGFSPSVQLRPKGTGGGFGSGSVAGAGTGGPGSAAALASLCTTVASDVATTTITPGTTGLPYIDNLQEPRPPQRLVTPPAASRDAAPVGPCPWPYFRPPTAARDGAGAVQAPMPWAGPVYGSQERPAPTPWGPPAQPPVALFPPPTAAPPLQGDLDAGPMTAFMNRRAVGMVNSILRAAGAQRGDCGAPAAAATATAAAAALPASDPMRPAQLRHLVTALECLAEVAAGLSYLHSVGMVHGDVKSGNVLLKLDPRQTRGFVLKLADFGFSRVLEDGSHAYLSKPSGTLAYLSPEMLRTHRQSPAADLYAFGILVWEVVTAKPLFRGMQTPQLLYAKTHNTDWQYLQWPAWCPPEVRELARRCSEYQPAARLTAEEARAQIEALRAFFQDTLTRTVDGAAVSTNLIPSPGATTGGLRFLPPPLKIRSAS